MEERPDSDPALGQLPAMPLIARSNSTTAMSWLSLELPG